MNEERKFAPAIANITVICTDCKKVGKMARLPKNNIPVFNWLQSYYACGYCGGKNIVVSKPNPIKNSEELNSLRTLLGEINNEITRYRDFEWKMVVWQISLSLGLFVFSNLIREKFSIFNLALTDIFIGILIILSTVLMSSNLLFVHGELTTNRNWRRHIERQIGYFNKLQALPSKWANQVINFSQGRDTFIIPFFLFMWISALSIVCILGWAHNIPNLIKSFHPFFIFVWQYLMIFILAVLLFIELYYIIRIIIKQGLTTRGPY